MFIHAKVWLFQSSWNHREDAEFPFVEDILSDILKFLSIRFIDLLEDLLKRRHRSGVENGAAHHQHKVEVVFLSHRQLTFDLLLHRLELPL